jgi:hypothetical protein
MAGVDLGGHAPALPVSLAHARDEERMDAVAIVLALAAFALMFGLIRAMDRI